MKNKNNKEKRPRPPKLDRIFNRVLITVGLYNPVTEENVSSYKIPKSVIKIYENQLEKEIHEEEIIHIYKTQGELFGYGHIDNDYQITIIAYNTDNENRIYFTMDAIISGLRCELRENYPLALRCLVLPRSICYDDDASDELLHRYERNKSDFASYTSIENYRYSILFKGKLFNHVYWHSIIEFYNEDSEDRIDAVIDLCKYKNDINTEWCFKTLLDEYKTIFDNLFKCTSFFKDKKPDNQDVYSSSFITNSLIGYNKLVFLFPSCLDKGKIIEFIKLVFSESLVTNNVTELDFFNRFAFYQLNNKDLIKLDNNEIIKGIVSKEENIIMNL